MKRIAALCLVLTALVGGLFVSANAQTIGCSNSIFGMVVTPCSASSAHIALSATTIAAGSANGTTLGTASIVGTVTGTAAWSLTDVSGTFQINSSTGVVTVLSNTQLTAGNTLPITISVTGVTPTVSSAPFTITVTATSCTNQLVINYTNTCALIAQAYGE